MRKYTDIQLSRILSVAAVGELGGNYTDENPAIQTVCIEQAAYSDLNHELNDYPFVRARGEKWDSVVNADMHPGRPDDVLAWLEENKMA